MKNSLNWLKKHRVAVLKGGWSRERPISLKTGQAVEEGLKRLGIWGQGIDVQHNIEKILRQKKIQFCFIALHGTYGEDGGIQALLQSMKIPFTGCDSLASAVAMDKNISKRLFIDHYVPTAPWMVLSKNQPLTAVKAWLKKTPLFVKPVDQGSALGASRVNTPPQLIRALKNCFRFSDRALVEKLIQGRELTVGILGKKLLPVVEIIPEHGFYDFHSKYAAGGSRHLVPAPLPKKVALQAQNLAYEAFRSLRCSVYGRVDLLLDKAGIFFVLEVNTIPGMTPTSLLPDAAQAAGISFDQLILRICDLSLKARGVL
ncbi:MAG: D-alanine--D-alanine ligase B [Elusimicrobia bacterium]|nr:D-alanine--D-alanine ligase B [Elusimicrobiota bacterium]